MTDVTSREKALLGSEKQGYRSKEKNNNNSNNSFFQQITVISAQNLVFQQHLSLGSVTLDLYSVVVIQVHIVFIFEFVEYSKRTNGTFLLLEISKNRN